MVADDFKAAAQRAAAAMRVAEDELNSADGRLGDGVAAAARVTLAAFRDKPCRIGRARMYAHKSVGIDDPGMLAFVKLTEAIAGT